MVNQEAPGGGRSSQLGCAQESRVGRRRVPLGWAGRMPQAGGHQTPRLSWSLCGLSVRTQSSCTTQTVKTHMLAQDAELLDGRKEWCSWLGGRKPLSCRGSPRPEPRDAQMEGGSAEAGDGCRAGKTGLPLATPNFEGLFKDFQLISVHLVMKRYKPTEK